MKKISKKIPEAIQNLKTASEFLKYWEEYNNKFNGSLADVAKALEEPIYFWHTIEKETEKAIQILVANEDEKLVKKWVAKSICKELSIDDDFPKGFLKETPKEFQNKIYIVPSWAIF
jgi:hypothetical protein